MSGAYFNLKPNGLYASGATKPNGDQATTVGAHLTPYLSPANPLIQQAQTKTRQAANQRGLVNSSMAMQAGTEASLQTAAQMASQDAQATAAREMEKLNYQNQSGLASQQNQHVLEQGAAQTKNQSYLAGQQHQYAKDLSNQQYGQQLGLAGFQHQNTLEQGQQQYGFQLGLADQQHGYAKDLSQQGFYQQQALNADQANAALKLDEQGYQHQKGLAKANAKHTSDLGWEKYSQQSLLDGQQQGVTKDIEFKKLNVGTQLEYDKIQALNQKEMADVLGSFAKDWNQAYESISKDTTLTLETRKAMYDTINNVMNRNVNAIKNMYGVNLAW
ncbi:MAG: hypothetical protein H7833_12385 [Magnetococcus sp. DMHC-1]